MVYTRISESAYRVDLSDDVMVLLVKHNKHWVFMVTNSLGCFGSVRYNTLKAAMEKALYAARREVNRSS